MAEKQTDHLTRKSVKAGAWLAGYRAFARLANLIKTPIIARILTPAQFGIFGVVSIALNLLETFSETGLEQALIHKKKITDSDVTTAWLIVMCRSLLVSLVLVTTAPVFSRFFNQPSTTLMIQVIALVPILRSLQNPNLVLYKRKLNFQRETVMLAAGSVAEVIVAIWAVVTTRSEWGLIQAILAGATAELITSYFVFSWPKFAKPNWAAAHILIRFGKWIWSSSSLSYLANQGDDIIVGRLLGAGPLGLYQNAYKIASLPATQVTGTITQVTFPAFSSIQDDKTRLLRAFKKSLFFTMAITIPMPLFTLIFAQPLTWIIFGDQWLGLVPALRVLSLYGIVRSLAGVLGPLANALGKPQFIAYNSLVRTLVMFSLIIPLTSIWGIVGASWASVIAITIADLVLIFQLKRVIT